MLDPSSCIYLALLNRIAEARRSHSPATSTRPHGSDVRHSYHLSPGRSDEKEDITYISSGDDDIPGGADKPILPRRGTEPRLQLDSVEVQARPKTGLKRATEAKHSTKVGAPHKSHKPPNPPSEPVFQRYKGALEGPPATRNGRGNDAQPTVSVFRDDITPPHHS